MSLEAAMRAVGRAVTPIVQPMADTRLSGATERYTLDPWAHCDDGHVRILDLETQKAVRFNPTEAQREMGEAWIDLDHLRATAALGEPEILFRNVHEEKSRQEGATTVLSWILLWVLMYHDARGIVLHVDGKKVDDGGRAATYSSIFGKIRYMAEHGVSGEPDGAETFWPEHLRPGRYIGFKMRTVMNGLRPSSYLHGATQTPDPGRGDHFTHALLDEAARLAWGESVQAAMTRAVPTGRFYNSTPFGKDNVYYRLRDERPANYIFLRHHWSGHPVYSRGLHIAGDEPKTCPLCAGNARGLEWSADNPVAHRYPGRLTSPWYDEAILELTDEQVAQELEIDYEGSLTARVYPEFSATRHAEPTIAYDPLLPLEFSIDYGWGASATWINVLQAAPGELRQIGEVKAMQSTPEQVVAELVEVLADLGVPLVELEPRFMRLKLAIGDPAGDAALATGGTLAGEYRKLGFSPTGGPNDMSLTINSVKRLLMGMGGIRFRISQDGAPETIKAFESNRWPTDRTGAIKTGAKEPLNDVHNDAMRSFAYYVTWKYPAPNVDESLGGATHGHEPSPLDISGPSGRIDSGISRDMKL